MKKENNRKIRAFGSRFEWTIVRRERATGKVIKTISLDPNMEIPDDVPNFSEYIRNLIKQDLERRSKTEAVAEKPLVAEEEKLTEAELELYDWLDNWAYFHKYGYEKHRSVHEYLKLQPDSDTLLNLLTKLDAHIEECQRQAEEEGNTERAEYFKVPRTVIQAVKNNPQLWNKVYDKFCAYWRQEHPQPEAYKKAVLQFEGKSWTGADILEKVLPQIDLLDRKPETMPQTTTKKIAEIFHVDYQTAFNKIVPHIARILKDAGVKII